MENDVQKQVVAADEQPNKQEEEVEDEYFDETEDEEKEEPVKGGDATSNDDESDSDDEEEDEKEDEEEAKPEEKAAPAPENKPAPVIEGKKEEKPIQSPEENAKYAAARREAEAKQRKAEEQLAEILKRTGMTVEDLKKPSYEREAEIREDAEKRGIKGDDVVEKLVNADYQKQQRLKTQIEEAEKAKQEALDARVQNDLKEFAAAYPNRDAKAILADENFKLFAAGKLGKGEESLAKVYNDYETFTSKILSAGAQAYASKAERSTGSANGAGAQSISPSQQRALNEWNKRYPDAKMSVDEFLGRKSK